MKKTGFFVWLLMGLTLMISTPCLAGRVHIDLTDSNLRATGQEEFKVYNLEIPGLEGKVWAAFKWVANDMAFEPAGYGPMKDYVILTDTELDGIISTGGDYVLMDVRSEEEYDKGHIYSSLNFPTEKITVGETKYYDFTAASWGKIEGTYPDKSQVIITYCGGIGCGRSGYAADRLVSEGYTNVYRFKGGYIGWGEAGRYFVIDGDQVKALVDEQDPDYTLVDVRTASEYNDGHIPTAINVPLETIQAAAGPADLPDLPQTADENGYIGDWEHPVIVYCNFGNRAEQAAEALPALGYKSVVLYRAGMDEWQENGWTVSQQ